MVALPAGPIEVVEVSASSAIETLGTSLLYTRSLPSSANTAISGEASRPRALEACKVETVDAT